MSSKYLLNYNSGYSEKFKGNVSSMITFVFTLLKKIECFAYMTQEEYLKLLLYDPFSGNKINLSIVIICLKCAVIILQVIIFSLKPTDKAGICILFLSCLQHVKLYLDVKWIQDCVYMERNCSSLYFYFIRL